MSGIQFAKRLNLFVIYLNAHADGPDDGGAPSTGLLHVLAAKVLDVVDTDDKFSKWV